MGRSKKKSGCEKKYSDEQLLCAIQAVKDGSSQFAAAKKYNIPRSTLYNKISGKSEIGKKSGPGTTLSAKEESVIEKWILNLAQREFPVKKRQLLRSIQLYLNTQKRKTNFVNNLPGRKWFKGFMKRHPIIAKRISQNLTPNRAAVTEDQIRRWHAEVYKYCEENNLLEALNDPIRIFNMDEKGFILTPKNDVNLTRRGDKSVYVRSQNDEKECVTALLGGNAAGTPSPPMMVHAYKRMPSTILLNSPAKWSVGISDNGWQTQITFFDYICNVFYKWLLEEKIQLPVILFIDGHKSHISLPLSEFCAANKIELVALYPNSTHLIQPMDVGVLKPVNSSWKKKVEDWKLTNQFAKIEKKDIATILNDAIKAIDYASYLKKGFEKCGLFPFFVDNIDFSKILPSTEAAAASQDELWNAGETCGSNHAQKSKDNDKSEALSRLTHFEGLIDSAVLDSFNLSSDKWSGPMEYAPLHEIWKKMKLEASDSSSMILDVDDSDLQVPIDTSNDIIRQCSMLSDTQLIWMQTTDDVQLPNSEATDSVTVEYDEVENYGFITLSEEFPLVEIPYCVNMINAIGRSSQDEADSMIVEDVQIENGESIEPGVDATEIYRSSEIEAEMIKTIGSSRNCGDDSMNADNIEIENGEFIGLGLDELCIDDNKKTPSIHMIKPPGGPIVYGIVVRAIDLSMQKDTSVNSLTTSSLFNVDAFKKSFYWPTAPIKKKKEKRSQEIRSTVVTSVNWRETERKKLNDKLQAEAEKQARKVARESKKMEAAAIAAEKKIAREMKKANKKPVQKTTL